MAHDPQLSMLYASAADAQSRGIADLYDYWRSKLRGRPMPHPNDIDPAELAQLMPNLVIIDYVGDPVRVRFRLVGPTQAHYNGGDFTGRYADEMEWSETDFIVSVHDALRHTAAPVFGHYQWDFRDHLPGFSEFGFFPLSEDGRTVSGSIGLDDCSQFEEQLDRAR